MGYTTDFDGRFKINPNMKPEHMEYLNTLAYTRRMKRDPSKAEQLDDPLRLVVGLPIGREGEFYVGSDGDFGQGHDASVANYNSPPGGQPSLWLQWVVEQYEDGHYLEWDGSEKFYDFCIRIHYVAWLQYLIDNFFQPWGYTLNGEVDWYGEDREDAGRITIEDNNIFTATASQELGPRRAWY